MYEGPLASANTVKAGDAHTPDFSRLKNGPLTRDFHGADHSGDSKTDGAAKVSTILSSDWPRIWTHFGRKRRNEPSLGRPFRRLGMCFTTLNALVWSVRDELVHVLDCTTSVFHSAWFGKTKLLQSSSAPCAGIVRERKNQVCTTVSVGAPLRENSLCVEAENHIMILHTENASSSATSCPGHSLDIRFEVTPRKQWHLEVSGTRRLISG